VPQLGRLVAVMLARAPAPPAPLRPFPLSGWRERARLVAKGLWLVAIVVLAVLVGVRAWHRHAERPALWGAYDVESFTLGGVAQLPALDARRWREVAFGANWTPAAAIVTGDGEYHLFGLKHDAAHGTIKLSDPDRDDDEDPKAQTLSVKTIDAAHLELDGTFAGEHVHAQLKRRDLTKATLNRDWHFVDDGGFWR
jgi:hypothetical protein